MKKLLPLFLIVIAFVIANSCSKEENPQEEPNKAPTCEITSPNIGDEFEIGENITISVEVEDGDGSIEEVRFYINGVEKGSANGFPYNYSWNTENEDAGNYTLKATSYDNEGESTSDEISVELIEGEPPVAAFSATTTNGTAPFTVSFMELSENEPTIWQWDFGDGGSSTQANPTHTYNSIGTYTVSLTVSNNDGSDTETKTNYIFVGYAGGGDLEWVNVNGGTFQMGSNEESGEQPIHTVTVSSFEISKYEITNAQYCEFLNAIGCNSNGSYNDEQYIHMLYTKCQIDYRGGQFVVLNEKTDFPVVEVSWYGANAFALWAGGRLPTEAEWEFAARGGNNSNDYTYSGSNSIDDVAWYGYNSYGYPHQVGTKAPNELGIYDMSGNLWEWCNDWYDGDYYSSSPQNNPQGPSSGTYRITRGGYFQWNADNCRVAKRVGYRPYVTDDGIGFRIVR